MASLECEISSSAPAKARADPTARVPNATAAPAITCRRVGARPRMSKVFLSLIIASCIAGSACPGGLPQRLHANTNPKYVQSNVLPGERLPSVPYCDARGRRRIDALSRWSPHENQRKYYFERAQAFQSVRLRKCIAKADHGGRA